MKNLATIQKILSVEPIEGADNIVKVTLSCNNNIYELVTQKTNNFKIGSFVVYFKVDSMLPKGTSFEWLASNLTKNNKGIEGYRITPMKRKGIISNGLCLPLNYFEETNLAKILGVLTFYEQGYNFVLKFYNSTNQYSIEEGTDLTEELGVFNF